MILEAVADGRRVILSDLGLEHLGRQMTPSEYRSLLATADRLAAAGAIQKRYSYGYDAAGRDSRRVTVRRSPVPASERPREAVPLTCAACGEERPHLTGYGIDGPKVCHGCAAAAITAYVRRTSEVPS